MVIRNTGIGAAILGFVLASVYFVPRYVTQWERLPEVDTMGQTVLVYSYLSRAAAFVLGIGVVFVPGYWAGSRFNLATDYQRFMLAAGLGGMLGHFVALAILLGPEIQEPILEGTASLDIAVMVGRTIAVGIQFAVVGFAGAAFAAVGDDPERGGGPDVQNGATGVPTGSND